MKKNGVIYMETDDGIVEESTLAGPQFVKNLTLQKFVWLYKSTSKWDQITNQQ